jgi:galactokinase/mevalonate kinase-like predicted kinase
MKTLGKQQNTVASKRVTEGYTVAVDRLRGAFLVYLYDAEGKEVDIAVFNLRMSIQSRFSDTTENLLGIYTGCDREAKDILLDQKIEYLVCFEAFFKLENLELQQGSALSMLAAEIKKQEKRIAEYTGEKKEKQQMSVGRQRISI